MKTFVDAVLNAEMVSTKNEKFAALRGLSSVGQRLMVEALSPYRVFGVKKYDAPIVFAAEDASPEIFLKLLDDLHNRTLTGNAARSMVKNVLSQYTPITAEVLSRVINKDLKAGFSETTINKLYPNLVDTFSVMLAKKIDDDFAWEFPVIAEAKYDGERTIAICENGVVTYYSRSGKEASHIAGLFDEDMVKLEKYLSFPVVIDGERYAGDFTTTQNAKKEGNDDAKASLRLYAFDYNSLDGWKTKTCKISQNQRRDQLAMILKNAGCTKIQLSEGKTVDSYAEVKAFYADVLSRGFEGLIIKNPDGLYEWDRSKNWNKWKPLLTLDGTITGFFEGRRGSKYEGTLGGIFVVGEDENGTPFDCRCGSGFSDDLRDEIFNNQSKYLGMPVEIEAQELSYAKNATIASARFPVFSRFREDKLCPSM